MFEIKAQKHAHFHVFLIILVPRFTPHYIITLMVKGLAITVIKG